ncbi:hypothetical protein ACFOWE_31290 [Planomonospora corallina]|uniref:Uncharacterized protein n=1 Tax=Planomonospora corallina TaxID=1806052 RepID=A0ABV8IIK2_9ACTN
MYDTTTVDQPAVRLEAEFRPDTIEHLRECMDRATAAADDYATKGAVERDVAGRHLAAAESFDDQAVKCRQAAAEWQALIDLAEQHRAERAERAEPQVPAPAAVPALEQPVWPPAEPTQVDAGPCPRCGEPMVRHPSGLFHSADGGGMPAGEDCRRVPPLPATQILPVQPAGEARR